MRLVKKGFNIHRGERFSPRMTSARLEQIGAVTHLRKGRDITRQRQEVTLNNLFLLREATCSTTTGVQDSLQASRLLSE